MQRAPATKSDYKKLAFLLYKTFKQSHLTL